MIRTIAAAVALLTASAAHAQTTIGDATNYAAQPYNAYLASFGKGTMVDGVGYSQAMVVQPSFPNGAAMLWSWPANANGVVCFDQIDFGNYDGSAQTIASEKVGAIVTLSAAHAVTLGGATADFDVIYDLFTTASINGGGAGQHEIEIFLHTPPFSVAYLASLRQIGPYFDANGVSWNVAVNQSTAPHDILFSPTSGADMLSATIDIRAMLVWLEGLKWVSTSEYFNGLALGAEVQQGEGSATISAFSISYQ